MRGVTMAMATPDETTRKIILRTVFSLTGIWSSVISMSLENLRMVGVGEWRGIPALHSDYGLLNEMRNVMRKVISNLLVILPKGVVSKNSIGAARILSHSRL